MEDKYKQNWGTMRLFKEMDHAFDYKQNNSKNLLPKVYIKWKWVVNLGVVSQH